VMDVVHTEIRHSCPICMEKTTTNTTCIFACCLNLFCTDCVKKVIQHNITCCPLCRTQIEYANIFKPAKEQTGDELLDKNATLLKLIVSVHNECSEYSMVIFAMYEESILSIQSALYNSMIPFKTLRGNNIHNTLQWFENTKCGVMIVNAQLHGSGLNINNTTHILMYQPFTPDLSMQLVGRAHRIGKTSPLYVHTLDY
jgi:SNF2 family DNA or RNA helicase